MLKGIDYDSPLEPQEKKKWKLTHYSILTQIVKKEKTFL